MSFEGIATASTDTSCFYELFVQSTGSSGSSLRECPIGYKDIVYVGGKLVQTCTISTTQSLAATYEPPFIYRLVQSACPGAVVQLQYFFVTLFL